MINATVIEVTALAEWDKPHSAVPQHYNIYTNDISPRWDSDSIMFKTTDDITVMVSADYVPQRDGYMLNSIQVFTDTKDRVAVINNRKNRPTVDRATIEKNLLGEGNHRFFYGCRNNKDRSLTIVILKEELE